MSFVRPTVLLAIMDGTDSVRNEQQALYKVFVKFESQLTEMLKLDELLSQVSQALIDARIIPRVWSVQKGTAAKLVNTVSTRIRYDPRLYDTFLQVLGEVDEGYFEDLIQEMK